jgi:signal transduction histidine kinase
MNYTIEQFYRFFQGALVFQGIFFGIIFFITRRKDVLWYALYLSMAAVYFFINASGTFFNINENTVFESAWYNWVNIPVIILENLFYLHFIKSFFSDLVTSLRIKKILRLTLNAVPFLLIVFLLQKALHSNTQVIFYTVNLLSIVPAIFIIVTVLRNKLPYASLVANGLLCMTCGTLLTVIMIYLGNNGSSFLLAASYPLLFIRLGLLGDMFFYQLALLKKWQFQEKELAVQQLEKQLAVEKVRSEISKELHDDIGSTLSGIHMYSHMARHQAETGNEDSAKTAISKIQEASGEMITRLKDMVWAIQPGHDTLDVLLERIKEYAGFMAGSKQMEAVADLPATNNALKISTEWRHQVFMIAKEIINNAVKYSGGSRLGITAVVKNNDFVFQIDDNGCGFNETEVKKGNGLENMQKRADEIGAQLKLITMPGGGTTWQMQTKIT